MLCFTPSSVAPVFSLPLWVRAPTRELPSYFGSVPVTLDLTLRLYLPICEVWLLPCTQWSYLVKVLSALGFCWWLQVRCCPWTLGTRDL